MGVNEGQPANKNILGSLIKTAAIMYGFYQLLNLSIFQGKHFRKENLTEEQIKAMDKHNKHHHQVDLVRALGRGVSVGLSASGGDASGEIAKADKKHLLERNEALDLDVAELPSPLNHKHTE